MKWLLALCLIASTSANADFAAHENIPTEEVTICHRKYNDGQPIYVSIDWENSIVQVNDVYTSIKGNLSNGAGISTSSFTNKMGSEVLFVISHHPGYPVLLQMDVAEPYQTDADGYGLHKTIDHVWLSCTQSFIKPFKKRMYSQK
jgi:hypothetical protein